MRRLRRSSPCTRFGRRRFGRGSSTEGAKLDVSGNGGRRSVGPILAGFGRGRARKEVEEVRGEAREVLARGIEAGWRATAGTTSGGVQHELCATRTRGRRRLERRRSFPGLREDKGGARRTRIAGMIDAWRSSPASTVAGRGMGEHSGEHGTTGSSFD